MNYTYSEEIRNAAETLAVAVGTSPKTTITKDIIVNRYNILASEGLLPEKLSGTKQSYLDAAKEVALGVLDATAKERSSIYAQDQQQRLVPALVRARNEALERIEKSLDKAKYSPSYFGWLESEFRDAGFVYVVDCVVPREFDPQKESMSFDELMDLRASLDSHAQWEAATWHSSSSVTSNLFENAKRVAYFKVLKMFHNFMVSEEYRPAV